MQETSPNSEEEPAALIGAMIDGWVETFNYRGLTVHRLGKSIGVSPEGPPQDCEGGLVLHESATVGSLMEWLENKADLYGREK